MIVPQSQRSGLLVSSFEFIKISSHSHYVFKNRLLTVDIVKINLVCSLMILRTIVHLITLRFSSYYKFTNRSSNSLSDSVWHWCNHQLLFFCLKIKRGNYTTFSSNILYSSTKLSTKICWHPFGSHLAMKLNRDSVHLKNNVGCGMPSLVPSRRIGHLRIICFRGFLKRTILEVDQEKIIEAPFAWWQQEVEDNVCSFPQQRNYMVCLYLHLDKQDMQISCNSSIIDIVFLAF